MRIRKIEEIINVDRDIFRKQAYHLIIDEKEEGWELTPEELIQVQQLIGEALKPDPCAVYIPAQLAFVDRSARGPVQEDHADECPDYIEPPEEHGQDEAERFLPKEVTEEPEEEPIISKSMGTCLSAEKVEKVKSEYRDYSKYIKMLAEGVPTGKIIDQMRDDFGVSRGSAQNYFYRYVKTDGSIKITVIEEKKPAPGKYFTDEERERIRREARV